MAFKERLKDLRISRNMTQGDLADAIGNTKQAISQYERGVRQPDFETLEALCDFFNVSSDYILGKSSVTMRFVDSNELKLLDGFSSGVVSELFEIVNRLNQEGREKVLEYAKLLDISGTYNICYQSELFEDAQ